MTFLETLQSHKGGLIRIKTPLYWYGGGGYDNNPGRICLILDAATITAATTVAATSSTSAADIDEATPVALLLVDGSPHWVWVVAADVELL